MNKKITLEEKSGITPEKKYEINLDKYFAGDLNISRENMVDLKKATFYSQKAVETVKPEDNVWGKDGAWGKVVNSILDSEELK